MALPRFMVMRSSESGKYLRYGKGKGSTVCSSLTFSHEAKRPDLDVATKGLDSSKERIATSEKTPLEFHLLKFEIEEAKNVPGFVNIRTCYNNKYLVRKSEESKRVVAEAHEAEEDQTKWSCTLFKPVFLDEVAEEEGRECVFGSNKHGIGMPPQKIQLMHVAKGEEYYLSESMELVKKEEDMDESPRALHKIGTTFTISDIVASAQLPKYVTFKCHDGSNYLGSPDWYGVGFQFSNMADQGVAMVNLNAGSGPTDVAIFCGTETEGGDWTPTLGDYCYIQLCRNHPCVFTPVKVNNYVAFYSVNIQKFLVRDPSRTGCLSALSPDINDEAQFQVGEPVLSRTILKINYDLDNARVYDTTDVTKITDNRSNYTNHKDTGSFTKDFTMSRTMSWNQSVTTSVGMSMSMTFGVPELGFGGEVSLKFDVSGTCTWGVEETKSETITHTYNFDVPPHTKQTKSVVASRSSCDVPFTCDVEDVLVDGSKHRYTIPDCVFKGANDYNANEKTYEEPLTS